MGEKEGGREGRRYNETEQGGSNGFLLHIDIDLQKLERRIPMILAN